jgi:hypothetical protein
MCTLMSDVPRIACVPRRPSSGFVLFQKKTERIVVRLTMVRMFESERLDAG